MLIDVTIRNVEFSYLFTWKLRRKKWMFGSKDYFSSYPFWGKGDEGSRVGRSSNVSLLVAVERYVV